MGLQLGYKHFFLFLQHFIHYTGMDGFQQNYAFFVDFLPCFGTMASAWLKQLIMLMMFGIMGTRSVGLGKRDRGAYRELVLSAQRSGPGDPLSRRVKR
jgi:hypothetical protein